LAAQRRNGIPTFPRGPPKSLCGEKKTEQTPKGKKKTVPKSTPNSVTKKNGYRTGNGEDTNKNKKDSAWDSGKIKSTNSTQKKKKQTGGGGDKGWFPRNQGPGGGMFGSF